jgi:hypothetical protein
MSVRIPKFKKPQDFFTNPQPCNAVDELQKEWAEREKDLIYYAKLREMQDFNALSDKVVGAENP